MQPFSTHTGLIAPVNRVNVDTDQIIPARFLTATSREGFGEHAFHDLRFLSDGSPNPDFALNQDTARGCEILVAGNNFGCGSSREHAPWALLDYGIKAGLLIYRFRSRKWLDIKIDTTGQAPLPVDSDKKNT